MRGTTDAPRCLIQWKKMDQVIAYWQEIGVDGFRGDMAHMEPPEFWKWLITRARTTIRGCLYWRGLR